MGKTERKCSLHTMARNESGVALVLSLLMLAMLTLIGTAGWTTANIETTISENYTTSIKSFYASTTGTEEAKARLKGFQDAANFIGDPDATPNPDWSAYLLTDATWTTSHDPNYDTHYENYFPTTANHVATAISANSLQTTNTYWVKLWYKREYDAELAGHSTTPGEELYADGDGSTATHSAASPGSIMFYGYKDTSSTTREEYTVLSDASGTGAPIILIRSYGYDDSDMNSQTILEIALRRGIGPGGAQAIFGDHIDSSGTALTINGNDQCECGWSADLCPDVYAMAWDGTDDPDLTGNPNITSTVGESTFYPQPLDIDAMVDELYADRTLVVTQDSIQNLTYGSPTNYEVVYANAIGMNTLDEVSFSNIIGYGTLVVHGNLRLTGSLDWYGMIIATGDVVFQGGAMNGEDKTVTGAVYAGEEASLNGTANVQYSACEIEKANGAYSYGYAGWKDTSL